MNYFADNLAIFVSVKPALEDRSQFDLNLIIIQCNHEL